MVPQLQYIKVCLVLHSVLFCQLIRFNRKAKSLKNTQSPYSININLSEINHFHYLQCTFQTKVNLISV